MSTAAAIPTRQLHPLVTLDYRVRMVSMVVVGLIPLFHFRGRPPLPALVGMAFTAILWPQTAHAMAGDEKKAREAGCDDFDTKPVEFARLLSKIEGLLQKRKAG
jgi:CheY-like chemotaxis protein